MARRPAEWTEHGQVPASACRAYILRIRFHERSRISVAGVAARNHQVNPTGNAMLIVFNRAPSSQAECRRLDPGLLFQEINLQAAWKTNISRAREDDDVAMAHHGWYPLPGDHGVPPTAVTLAPEL